MSKPTTTLLSADPKHLTHDASQTDSNPAPTPGDSDPLLGLSVPALLDSGVSFTAVKTTPAPVITQTLYLTEQGDTAAISVNDIHQGQIGDCFLLSSIGELALWHPSFIQNMIKVGANGTETVTLFKAANGSLPSWFTTAFKVATQTVTNSFPTNSVNNGATQDLVGTQKEIWPQVIEKAYAQANGGYGGIQNGGSPVIALEELTGHAATWQPASTVTLALLQSHMAAGDLIVMDTGPGGSAKFNLVGSHAYMFEGLVGSGSSASVKLGNPWGLDQPALIPVSQLSQGIVEVDIGHIT